MAHLFCSTSYVDCVLSLRNKLSLKTLWLSSRACFSKTDYSLVSSVYSLVFTASLVRLETSASVLWALVRGPIPTRGGLLYGREDKGHNNSFKLKRSLKKINLTNTCQSDHQTSLFLQIRKSQDLDRIFLLQWSTMTECTSSVDRVLPYC